MEENKEVKKTAPRKPRTTKPKEEEQQLDLQAQMAAMMQMMMQQQQQIMELMAKQQEVEQVKEDMNKVKYNNFKEIQYSDLSTGQRKSVDVAIIFGIIQNIIANVNFNIFFLDELMSNMDAEARNNMLSILKETLSENRTIFVINHAEMQDDFFNHKIRVRLNRKKIMGKTEEIFIKNSTFKILFYIIF